MIGVIDTSALIRLFVPDGPIPDGLDEFFQGVERGRNIAIAPELIVVESANVINKKRKAGEISEEESRQLLLDILAMPIRLFPHRPLIQPSFDLASEYELTLYDALFLALATAQGAIVFSTDEAMVKVAGLMNL
ncbi:MAG: type II toxin-antitoxin system VapC family toxin [Deltaproteobacteria bacterium]|nr:type II toxin-antitoxin system VapC family toxin [Deltaproteobacteria bacterium]